jgi:hypothetical protein
MEYMTEYAIDLRELERRKSAFTRLLISFVAGGLISSADVLLALRWIAALGMIVVVVIVMVVRYAFVRFLRSYARMKYVLTPQWLERTRKSRQERFALQKLTSIHIKRTSKGTIREITMRFRDGQRVYVNALEQPEQFKDALLAYKEPAVVVTEWREPLDYDHPLFYIIFGGLVGVVLTTTLRLMTHVAANQILTINYLIALYVAAIGVYWMFTKPLANRYGDRLRRGDIVCGWVLVGIGIVLSIYTLQLGL